MPEARSWSNLSLRDRLYVVARLVVVIGLVLLYVLLLRVGFDARSRALYVGSLGLLIATTLVALGIRLYMDQDRMKVLWGLLPFDVVTLGMLIDAARMNRDPFYPLVLGLAVLYAVVVGLGAQWWSSGFIAAAYVLSHLVGHGGTHTTADWAFFLLNAVGIIVISSLVSLFATRQRARNEELAASRWSAEGLNQQLKRTVSELRAVSEITEIIHSTLDFEEVGPLVLETLQKALGMSACSVFVIDKVKAETLFSASRGIGESHLTPPGVQYLLDVDAGVAPARVGDDMFSCIALLDHKDMMVVFCTAADLMESMGEDDRLVLQAVAGELVVAVENSRLYKLTKRMAITDELTGLFNYRYLQQRLDEEYERARRYGRNLSMLMLDVDDFKNFNDTHGHIAGDVALAEVGSVTRSAVREIDVVCRYGGEEFAVILPETDAAGAFVVAEKVREAIAAHLFPDEEGRRGVHITVSIGLASLPLHAHDKEGMLKQADDALYKAKEHGRDRVRAPSRPGYMLDEEAAKLPEAVGELGFHMEIGDEGEGTST